MPNLEVTSTNPKSELASLVDDYLMECRARGLARATLTQSYGYPLRGIFLPWCEANGLTSLSQVTSRRMTALSVMLLESPGASGRQLSKATVHSYTRGIRGFLQWCASEGEGQAAKPSLPRLPRRLLNVLGRDEIDALEAAGETERDRIMLRILGDCGLRSYELASLCPDQIIRHDRQTNLHVHGKGERDRFVPLPPSLSAQTGTLLAYWPATGCPMRRDFCQLTAWPLRGLRTVNAKRHPPACEAQIGRAHV